MDAVVAGAVKRVRASEPIARTLFGGG